jgi:rubrerythrin
MRAESMELKGSLAYAIHAEIQAEEFYRNWANSVSPVTTEEALLKTELEKLAEWEEGHANQLKELYERSFGQKFVPDSEVVVDPALKVRADWFGGGEKNLVALSVAYVSETSAAAFYDRLAERVDGKLIELFEGLADMERDHAKTILKRYSELREMIERESISRMLGEG